MFCLCSKNEIRKRGKTWLCFSTAEPFSYLRSRVTDRQRISAVECFIKLGEVTFSTLKYSFTAIHTDAHTVADVDYKWKGGKGVEIVSSEMAQFDLLQVVTENEASTNSKGGNKENV